MVPQQLNVGVDIGTSGCKVTVLDEDARVVAVARAIYQNAMPHPGWVEQDPFVWFGAAREAITSALAALSPAERRHVTAFAFSAPTHVAVLTDAEDAPLRPALMWNDVRSAREARELAARHGELINAISGNGPTPTWTLPHLIWIRSHEPEVFARVRRLWFMKDWVRAMFTRERHHYTDRVDAQGTLLYNVRLHEWSRDVLDLAGVPLSAMPVVREPVAPAGTIRDEFARSWDLPAGLAVATGTTDTAAELLAAGVITPGAVAVKLATAGNVAKVATGPPPDPRLLGYEHVVPGRYYWNSGTSSAAASRSWFASQLSDGRPDYDALDSEVLSLPSNADTPLFLPFLLGERSPRFDPALRGGFIGLTAQHSRAHLVRSVMEGVAFSLKDAASLYTEPLPDVLALVGGGARSRAWPALVADILDRRVLSLEDRDSSFGAALIAATSTGRYSALDEARAISTGDHETAIDPNSSRVDHYSRRFDLYRQAADAVTAVSHALSGR